MRRQYPDRLDLFLPTLARFFRIAPAILRLHLSLPPKHQLVSRHDCRPPREQGYANVQGLQAIQYHEMEGPVGRFTAPTLDAIRQALRKANRRNSGFHAR